jgi:inorganic pyrophosphatase
MEGSFAAVEATVEIPQGSRNKYEFDHAARSISLNRVLFSSVHHQKLAGLPEEHPG